MSDLKQYINKRKATDKKFLKAYDKGYVSLKVGLILSALRKKAGLSGE